MNKTTWNEWHQKSQQAIADHNLPLALDCEIAAINALDPKTQQRTLGITVVSACAIAFRARDFDQLNKIAREWMARIPQEFEREVKSILVDMIKVCAKIIDDLGKIQQEINEILSTIDRSDFDHLAANWADLSCTEVSVLVGAEDGFEAIVEEACPIDRSLAEWIEGQLFDRGWPNVTVRTEW